MKQQTAKLILKILGFIVLGCLTLLPPLFWAIGVMVGWDQPYLIMVIPYGFISAIIGLLYLTDVANGRG